MVYPRRFGAFMPLVSFASSLAVTYPLKPRVMTWSPTHWQALIVLVGLTLFGTIYGLIYVLYLVLLRFGAKRDLWPALKKRWRQVLVGDGSELVIGDYIDRVADLQVRISTPSLLKDVVAEVLAEHKTACVSLQRTIDHYAESDSLRAFISVLGNHWRTPTEFELHPPRLIDDPVHGCISLDSQLATVIAQPIVQRLSRIRQLSFSYKQFPSATHSRLSHVLGVAHNVDTALSGIFSRGVFYEEGRAEQTQLPKSVLDKRDEIIQRAKLLAILHDLGHGPFGHALDNYVGYINQHQTTANPDKVYSRLYAEKYLSTTLRRLGFDPDDLIRVLNPERTDLTAFDSLIGDLIDSSMDMDRMDYLMRDAHMTGLSMGFTNADTLIQSVRPVRVDAAYLLAYDLEGVEYMEHLLYSRQAMYRSCYEHPRKRSAERLFERLIREIAADDPELIDDLYILTDEEIICALRLANLKSDRAQQLLNQIVSDSDYAIIHDVQASSRNISEEAKVWVKGAAKGKGKQSYIDKPAQWEDAIARNSIGADRVSQIQVIVAPPGAYELKFDAATILLRDGDGVYRTKEFLEVASGVKDVLSAMNKARAKIKVMCPSNLSTKERELVRQASIAELGF